MKEYIVNTKELKALCPVITSGVLGISAGSVDSSRVAAHLRSFEVIEQGKPLPYDLNGAVIYYAGPTPTPKNAAIGSCGPTTSKRMDPYTPRLFDLGVVATIGKGERSKEVCEAIKRNRSVYLCAIGGAGALAALSISKCEVIAFDDLGCESVKRLEFDSFPLTVGIDCNGGNIFER